jgi:hypothetical protein
MPLHPPMDGLENFSRSSCTNATDEIVAAEHQFTGTAFPDSLPLVCGEPTAIRQAIEQPIGSDRCAGRGKFTACGLENDIRKKARSSQGNRELIDANPHQNTSLTNRISRAGYRVYSETAVPIRVLDQAVRDSSVRDDRHHSDLDHDRRAKQNRPEA